MQSNVYPYDERYLYSSNLRNSSRNNNSSIISINKVVLVFVERNGYTKCKSYEQHMKMWKWFRYCIDCMNFSILCSFLGIQNAFSTIILLKLNKKTKCMPYTVQLNKCLNWKLKCSIWTFVWTCLGQFELMWAVGCSELCTFLLHISHVNVYLYQLIPFLVDRLYSFAPWIFELNIFIVWKMFWTILHWIHFKQFTSFQCSESEYTIFLEFESFIGISYIVLIILHHGVYQHSACVTWHHVLVFIVIFSNSYKML